MGKYDSLRHIFKAVFIPLSLEAQKDIPKNVSIWTQQNENKS